MNAAGEPNVLIVEDDKFLGELLVSHFKEKGFSFDLAQSGPEAFEKIGKTTFDLVLLDIILPGMDGYEILRQLKANPETAQIPVIIFSNLGQDEEIKKGLELGAAGFFIKAQLDLDDIAVKIKETLTKKK